MSDLVVLKIIFTTRVQCIHFLYSDKLGEFIVLMHLGLSHNNYHD